MQGVEDPKKGSGLEFAYIDVRDDYRDGMYQIKRLSIDPIFWQIKNTASTNYVFTTDHTRLSVWVLDGDPGHANLLRFALNKERFPHTLIMLVAAMTTPWAILDQLQSWAALLGDHIDKLPLDNDTRQRCRQFSK